MPFALQIEGRWRVTVVVRSAAFDQRVLVSGSAAADGAYAGVVGTSFEVGSAGQSPWTLKIQHNSGAGWANSELRQTARVTTGSQIVFHIESEDLPGQPNPDFDDLIVRLDKVGAIEVPFRPYAVRPGTMQMMPDGIFEAALGTYYMGVRVQNVWTQSLPAGAQIGISAAGRTLLAAGGIQVVDVWTPEEQEAVGQQMSGPRVVLGQLPPWAMKTIYFKVNCTAARPRKHLVIFELVEPAMPDPNHPNRRATQKIFATRSGYNPVTKEFVAECDAGRVFLRLREITAEYASLRDAVRCARRYRAQYGNATPDRLRQLLQDILDGRSTDLCELKRLLDCICSCVGGDQPPDHGTKGWPCGDILMFPTKFDYRVEFRTPFADQLGPIPFDDPWWKCALIILAIILTILAGASAASDLAYKSDDVVIGSLADSSLFPEADGKFLVDAATCELNGSRDLPSTSPPIQLRDAAGDETAQVPVESLGGDITLSGETLSNSEIADLIAAFLANPDDPVARDGVRAFKSGARSGTTHARMAAIEGLPRTDHDGVTRVFRDQILFLPLEPPDPGADQITAQHGDSGSLWVHTATRKILALEHAVAGDDSGSRAHATRIEDVMAKMNIRFV